MFDVFEIIRSSYIQKTKLSVIETIKNIISNEMRPKHQVTFSTTELSPNSSFPKFSRVNGSRLILWSAFGRPKFLVYVYWYKSIVV